VKLPAYKAGLAGHLPIKKESDALTLYATLWYIKSSDFSNLPIVSRPFLEEVKMGYFHRKVQYYDE